MSPVYSRQYLRQALGQHFIHDTLVANTYSSIGAGGSVWFGDSVKLPDPTSSGMNKYTSSWVYHPNSQQTFRVASFNFPSGAAITGQLITGTQVASGDMFELHDLLSPFDKNAAIDRALNRVTVRQEVGFWSAAGWRFYDIENTSSPNFVGSPNYVRHILDAYYYGDPTNSLNRQKGTFAAWSVVPTGSGRELRIWPALGDSHQIVLDCIIDLTLGAAETATVYLPDDDWVLWGAAAHAYNDLIARTPGQPTEFFMQRRMEAAHQFTRLSARFQPRIARKLTLDEGDRGNSILLDDRSYG